MNCLKHNIKMTQLFNSWVCDVCSPPKNQPEEPSDRVKIRESGALLYTPGYESCAIGPIPASMVFGEPGVEYLRFEPDGKVYVRGQLVDDNMEVYKAFLEFMAQGRA